MLIENSLINLYRRTFAEQEIDERVSFIKLQLAKTDKEYILLMVESTKDAEQILKSASKNIESNDKK